MTETFGEALRRFRGPRTQRSLGRLVNVSGGHISELERGGRLPTRDLAERLDVATDARGALIHIAHAVLAGRHTAPTPVTQWRGRYVDGDTDQRVTRSQDDWIRTRAALNAHRPDLTRVAADLYGTGAQLEHTGVLAGPGWIPDQPVDLSAVKLEHQPAAADPDLDGTEPEALLVRPLAARMKPYRRYTHAVRDLNHPRLFENRVSWRLTGVDWADGRLSFGDTTYFAGVDVCEAVAHELACAQLDDQGDLLPTRPALRDLPYRRLVGDPFDLERRPGLTSVDTLTIRGGPDPAFLLHRRDPRAVAVAGGTLAVVPCGVFQPSSLLPAARTADFDLWRNVMREYSEELLGNAEHDGDGHPVVYDQPPFSTLETARGAGRVRPYCLGVALDALTLIVEVLSVVVFDPATFDRLFAHMVEANEEGEIARSDSGDVWVPFTEDAITELDAQGVLTPASAGCLELAWRHREQILGQP